MAEESTRTSSAAEDEYAGIARWYDLLLSWPMRGVRTYIRKLITGRSPASVLDIACGTGQQLRMLTGCGIRLTGVDASAAMLAIARRKGETGIDYLQADATALPQPDDSFNCVILSMSIHECSPETRLKMLAEARRVLAPGGLMIIADYCALHGWWSRAMSHIVRFVERQTEGDHYANYLQWMKTGALEGFLERTGCGLGASRHFLSGNVAVRSGQLQP